MNLLQLNEPGQTPLPHAEDKAAAVGIDLGTTHSVVAYAHEGRAEVLKDIHGNTLVPSVVSYAGDAPVVGYPAREQRARGERLAIASIKRLMGRGAEDIKPLMGELPYDIMPGQSGMAQLNIKGRGVSPVEISAEILKHLKMIAERALGHEVTRAVITVPAYFDDTARAATKDAARIAGLSVLRLVNEPTAAALAYGLDQGVEGIYAVYDLGGGTFDISLLKLEKGVFQVLATGGDTALGGDDFDHALAERLHSSEGGNSKPNMGIALASARRIKEALSEKDSVDGFARAEFEALIRPLVDRSLHICRRVLSDAGLKPKDIKGVVLVGGSTRVPLVRACVQEFFGQPPLVNVNPDEVVAVGAALQASALTHGSDNLLLDVIPLSLGLETMGGLTEKLIHRNTPIPIAVAQEFTTYQDNQNGMQFHIVQGEREMVAHNRSLARFDLKGIPPLPAGVARVRVNFAVDADGLLTVSAEEATTGAAQTIHVKPSYGLPPEEIERMLLESMANAQQDITERLLAEAKIEAERAIEELLSAMRTDPELLTAPEKTLIECQITYVREAVAGDDRDRIDVEIQQLGQAANAFAQRRMDKAVGAALKGAHVDNALQKITGENHA